MKISKGSAVPVQLLSSIVKDKDGKAHTLSNLLEGATTVVLFVRHFGCIGCSENIGLLSPRFEELSSIGAQVLVIGCGPSMFIEGFRERHRLLFNPAEVYTDETLHVQRAAGLMYSAWGGFRPRALIEMARAFVNGHVSGPNEGDIKQQAGAMIVDKDGIVRLYHRNESLGDHVDGTHVVDTALKLHLQNHPELV